MRTFRINSSFGSVLIATDVNRAIRTFSSADGQSKLHLKDNEEAYQVAEQTPEDPLGLIGYTLSYRDLVEGGDVRVGIIAFHIGGYEYELADGLRDTYARFRAYVESETWRIEDGIGTTEAKAEPASAIHTESLTPRRGQGVPDVVLAAAIDRGERHVRRTLREWPYGKTLGRRQIDGEDLVKLEWFWIESEAV